MNSDFLTSCQAAEYLGVALEALGKWRSRKIGPAYYKVGRQVQYKKTDLDEWRERQKIITKR